MLKTNIYRTAVALAVLLTAVACGRVYDRAEAPREFTLPAGTTLAVTPTEGFDLPEQGDEWRFAGVLAEPLEMEGELVAPKGAAVAGTATRKMQPADPDSGEPADVAEVGITLESITVYGGDAVAVSTAPVYPTLPSREALSDVQDEDVLTFVLNRDVELSLAIPVQPVSEDNG